MDFKSSDESYSFRFLNHFERFISQYQLFSTEDALLVAVSGGVDSIAVLYALSQLKRFGYSLRLRALHLNHGTRIGQDAEEKFVHEFCHSLGIECISHKLEDLDPNRNFEYKARLKRYEKLHDIADDNEKIVLAHHIDDSFEWSMLQTLKSSSIEGLVGIPLVNDNVIRPFMCVTKDQIRRFAACFDLPFIEDPTNEQIKYERNYIRNEVVPAFEARYKKYLKHYVYRHNEIARRLGLHYKDRNQSHFNMSLAEDSVLIFSLHMNADYSGIAPLIKRAMAILNPNSRGVLAKQIENIKTALKNGKQGPLALTNGVQAYLDFNLILLTKIEQNSKLDRVYKDFKTFSFEEYSNYMNSWLSASDANLDFPFITLCKHSFMKSKHGSISYNTECSRQLRGDNVEHHPALRLLREWAKKRNRHKVLRLNFLR